MSSELAIPAPIEAVVQKFEQATAPFTVMDVQQALSQARRSLDKLSEAENCGAWSEILAFSLTEGRDYAGPSPWGTFFCPLGSVERDGNTIYFPDIDDADAPVIAHWTNRAKTVVHPVLKARYADLVWELSPTIAKTRRDPDMARIAVDAYLTTSRGSTTARLHDRFTAALRALDLASVIRDRERIDQARGILLGLHHDAIKMREGPWWLAFDRLIGDKNVNLSDEERDQLVTSLEDLVLHYGYTSDTSGPQSFNPHGLERAAERLDATLRQRLQAAPQPARPSANPCRSTRAIVPTASV
jgi:hypothetical protein